MAHHSSHEPDPEIVEAMRKMVLTDGEDFADPIEQRARELQLGATGQFPQGKLTEHDEGEIRMGVTVKDGKVVIAFGKPTTWVGMDPRQAYEMAAILKKRADEARG